MAKGLDTMIQENPKEEITESSGLQLGTADGIIDSTTIRSAENEVADLTIKNAQVCSKAFNLEIIEMNFHYKQFATSFTHNMHSLPSTLHV